MESTYGRVGSLSDAGSLSRSTLGEDTINLEISISRSTKLWNIPKALTRFPLAYDTVLLHRQRWVVCPSFRGFI